MVYPLSDPSSYPLAGPSPAPRDGCPGVTVAITAARARVRAWLAPTTRGRARPAYAGEEARPDGRGSLRERFSSIESGCLRGPSRIGCGGGRLS
jgi:hypothetical protein